MSNFLDFAGEYLDPPSGKRPGEASSTMASIPSTKVLEKELADAVHRIYNSDEQDLLTVNYARQVVQKKLGLPEGFFHEGEWKSRSKNIVHAALVSYEEIVTWNLVH